MVVTRISTYNTFLSTIDNAVGVQGKLFDLQKQISSGHKTDRFEGLFGEIEAFTSLDDKMKRTEEFLKNNSILSSRVTLMSRAIDNVIDTTTELRNITVIRRNGTAADNMGFENQLSNLWTTIASQLNASVEGRYLFGGIRTDTPPVDANTFPNLFNDNQQPEDGYYQGATQNIVMRLEDDYDVTLDVRADNMAIQKIYAGFATALEGHNSSNDTLIATSLDLISEGLEEVSLMQVDLATIQVNVNDSAERLDQLGLYWKGVKENMISTDLVAASSEVALNQGILQASFQAFARINSLQLSDFLR